MTLLGIFLTLALLFSSEAVDRSKFKKCDQTYFCKTNRAFSEHAPDFKYSLLPETVRKGGDGHSLVGTFNNPFAIDKPIYLEIRALAGGE
jgi:hypothetical protein